MKQKVALALGSGGARGLAHIGAIRELEDRGFEITSVSGTSMGSVISGLYAMNQLEVFTKWVSTLSKKDVYSLMDFTVSKSGLITLHKLFDTMKKIIPDMNIEDMPKPYVAVATDIINGKEVHFTSGSFYDAMRASIAIPSIITPVNYEDTILVDGGVLNPVPMDCITRTENDILVAINLYDIHIEKNTTEQKTDIINNDSDKVKSINRITALKNRIIEFMPHGDKKSKGYIELLNLTTSAMLDKLSSQSLKLNKPDIIINIPANAAKSFDFHKSNEIIKVGKAAAKESIDYYYRRSETT